MRFVTPLASACSLSLALFCLTTTGCSKGKADEAKAEAKPAVAPATTADLPNADPSQPAPPMVETAHGKRPVSQEVRPMMGRLAYESQHRPKGALSVESVTEKLKQSGIQLGDLQQYLANATNAAFCAGAKSSDGLDVTVCEYADDQKAADSVAALNKSYTRDTLHRAAHRNAMISILAPAKDARVDKAIEVFQSM